ncbi:MAG: MBOAT family protein [Lachnospiraceae bacterium]|nr:MBOAT family protein [Lachnospiraceae bacterium]
MQIVSVEFICFFIVIMLIYHALPARFRCPFLLMSSYFFYGSQNIRYLLFLIVATLFSYTGALIMNRFRDALFYKKLVFIITIIFNLAMLGYFKYAGFLSGGRINSLILPAGISFYLFMSCGYLADVYQGRIPVERNLFRYALFVSFFPTILSGPIERAGNMLPQFSTDFLKNVRFDTERIRDGFTQILWGYFMKLVLSDRISILVSHVYAAPEQYGGALLAVTSVLYTFRIYCDFAGYSHIVIGIAKTLGIRVMENFKCPYLAESVADFWRRWHISLSSWFRDYIYIPLGGNRKGTVRKYCNIMIVFLLSGLWHGAGWTFIIWGGLHGLYQVIGALLMPVCRKAAELLNLNTHDGVHTRSLRVVRIAVTFLLVNFAWIIFQAENMGAVLHICERFLHPKFWELFDGTFYTLGLDRPNVALMFLGLLMLIMVDLFNERGIFLSKHIAKERLWIRWPVYIGAILLIGICGVWGSGYDTANFIYYRF